jgi:hypothetical protein
MLIGHSEFLIELPGVAGLRIERNLVEKLRLDRSTHFQLTNICGIAGHR